MQSFFGEDYGQPSIGELFEQAQIGDAWDTVSDWVDTASGYVDTGVKVVNTAGAVYGQVSGGASSGPKPAPAPVPATVPAPSLPVAPMPVQQGQMSAAPMPEWFRMGFKSSSDPGYKQILAIRAQQAVEKANPGYESPLTQAIKASTLQRQQADAAAAARAVKPVQTATATGAGAVPKPAISTPVVVAGGGLGLVGLVLLGLRFLR